MSMSIMSIIRITISIVVGIIKQYYEGDSLWRQLLTLRIPDCRQGQKPSLGA